MPDKMMRNGDKETDGFSGFSGKTNAYSMGMWLNIIGILILIGTTLWLLNRGNQATPENIYNVALWNLLAVFLLIGGWWMRCSESKEEEEEGGSKMGMGLGKRLKNWSSKISKEMNPFETFENRMEKSYPKQYPPFYPPPPEYPSFSPYATPRTQRAQEEMLANEIARILDKGSSAGVGMGGMPMGPFESMPGFY